MFTAKDGKVYFQLQTGHGEIVLTSRGYRNQVDAILGIESVMRYGVYDSRFLRTENAKCQFLFELQSPGRRTIGWSPTYLSKQGRENGIIAVRRALQSSRVLDLN